METIKLDRQYGIKIESKNPYADRVGELIEDILKAQNKKEISEKDAALLLNITLRVEMKKDIHSWFVGFSRLKERPETYTMVMQVDNKNFKHA